MTLQNILSKDNCHQNSNLLCRENLAWNVGQGADPFPLNRAVEPKIGGIQIPITKKKLSRQLFNAKNLHSLGDK